MDGTIQYILNTLLGLVIAYIVTTLSRIVREFSFIRTGICALLHNQLYQTCEKYLERGCISSHDLEDLDRLFKCYKSFGMNGAGMELYERCKKLEIRS